MRSRKIKEAELVEKFQQLYFNAYKTKKLKYAINKTYFKKIHHNIPTWHLEMLKDVKRNEFYKKALKNKVKNKIVFEIGTGFGYLSLLCAELGARHIYTCEENPIVYNYAKQFIKENNLENQITIFNKNSKKIKLKSELVEKVDIILSEVFSADVFSEGVLKSLEDAKRFLKDGGVFIPEKVNLIENYLQQQEDALEENEFVGFLNLLLNQRLNGIMWEFRKHKIISKNVFKTIELNNCSQKMNLTQELKLPKFKTEAKNIYFALSFEIIAGKNVYNSLGKYDLKSTRHWAKMSSLVDLAIKNKEKLKLIYENEKWDIIA